VVRVGPEPPAVGRLFAEPAVTALDLQGEQPAPYLAAVDHLDVGVDAVVLGRLFAENPAQDLLDIELGPG
jgi:hypothetical protein